MKTTFISLSLLVLTCCSPSSVEDFRHEGESRCRALVLELKKIQTPEELHRAEPTLKKHFNSLVILMLEAKRFQQSLDDPEPIEALPHQASIELKEELRRIYAFEGGREAIERAQQEALEVLTQLNN